MNPTTTSSEFGISNFWASGDTISHFVAILLLLMSIGSWFVLVTKFIHLWKIKSLSKEVGEFWKQTSWQDGLNYFTKPDINPFQQLAISAYRVTQEHRESTQALVTNKSLSKHLNAEDWLASAIKSELDSIIKNLQNGLAFLASTGATAPFIGLFGTVWGIYHALMVIGSTGSASLDQVAGPIGEALVMTALGLTVAIPAVLGYNALNKANRDLVNELKHFAEDLHTFMMTTSADKRN